MRISPAQHDLFIQATIGTHIASLVDKHLVKREETLPPAKRQKRRELQAAREFREANREPWECK